MKFDEIKKAKKKQVNVKIFALFYLSKKCSFLI